MTDTAGNQSTIRKLWHDAWRQPRGRWPLARWGFALLLPIAIVLWGISALLAPDEPDLLRVTVESQASGNAIEGASVTVGEVRYVTDVSGMITINPVGAGTNVVVSAAGHESTRTETAGGPDEALTVSLSAVLVLGSVSDIVSGTPVVGAELVVRDAAGEEVAATRTDESGTFVFKFIPEDAEIVITHEVYGTYRHPLDDRRSLQIQLAPPEITGRVVSAQDEPISGARITGPQVDATTDGDGVFRIEGVGQGMELEISREGIGVTTVIVSGIDLGSIRLPSDASTPEASPGAGEGSR